MSGLDPVFLMAGIAAITTLFLAAAAHKLAQMARFRAVVANYRLLPPSLSGPVAMAVPLLELGAAGAAFAVPFTHEAKLLAPAAAMLLLYALAIAINLVRGRAHIDCGCTAFRAGEVTVGWSMVTRNLGMAAVILPLAAIPVSSRALGAADAIALAGIVVIPPFLYMAFGEWRALRQKGTNV